MAVALGQMGSVYQDMGNIDKAIEMQERAMAIDKERGDEEGQAISLHQLSMLHRKQGDLETALARSREAEALDRKRGDQAGLAADLHEQGLIFNRMARAAEDAAEAARHREAAFERFQASLEIKHRIGDEAGAADSLAELAKLLAEAGQYKEAVSATNEALETARRLGDPVKTGIRIEFLGSVHERQGQIRAALEKYREALALFKQYASPQYVEGTERNIARVQAKLKRG
jgi:tetratricopeptide (TPR) repeat protein